MEGFEDLRTANSETLIDHLCGISAERPVYCLEIGCGDGWFLKVAESRGIIVEGIEPSENSDVLASQGFNVTRGFFPEARGKRKHYDMIVFNDVFEHIPNPDECLKVAESTLSTKGILVINYPSSDGVFYQASKILKKSGIGKPFKRMWQFDFPSPHLFYFNKHNLSMLVSKNTSLQLESHFSLSTLRITGLWRRIRASYSGTQTFFIFIVIAPLSLLLPYLKPDIQVSVFTKS